MSVSWLFRWYSLVSVKGAEEEFKAYEGETNGSTRYHGCRGNDLFEQSLSRDSCVESLLSKVVLSGGLCWQHQRFRVMFKKRCSFRLLQRNSQKFGVYRLLRLTRLYKSFKLASISAGNSGEGDVIPDSTKEWNHEPDHGELVAEDATRRIHCSRWKHYHLYTSTTIQDIPSFPEEGTMARDQKGELTKEEKLLIKAMTNHINQTMDKMMKAKMEELRQEVKHKRPRATGQSHEYRRSERRQRCEHESRGSHRDKLVDQKLKIPPFHGQADPAAYAEWEKKLDWWNQLIKSRRLDGKEPVETWLKLRALIRREYVPRQYHKKVIRKQSETKPCSANSVQKQQFRIRSSSTGVIGLPSKTTSWFSEEDTKELSQVILDVEKQLRETNTTRPSLEEQSQESITSVSELNSTEPDMKEKEAPKEPQSDCELNQLIVFDPCDFQNTFLGTFLISPFVWNKPRAVEPSRHELGINHVVFEPGGELWSHGNNTIMIEKKSAAITIVFGDLLPFGDKVSHVSTQQEFLYETNCRMLPTMSWIQKTRQQRKWPPDDQDIVNFSKHIGLAQLCEMLISDYAERLQTYSWRPGAYVQKIIILGECSARARTSWGSKELEVDQNALLLDHVKVWKPPDLQKLQYHFRDCQTMSGDGDFTRGNGEVITGAGGELMVSSQIKEKPPDGLNLHQSPNKPTRGKTVFSTRIFEKGRYNDQSINDESLDKLEMQQSNLGNCLATSIDIGEVRGSYLYNQRELTNKLDCNGNFTHQGLTSNWNHVQSFSGERVMDSTSRVIMCLLCLNLSEFKTSQSYQWRPSEHAKHSRRNYKRDEDKRFKPPDLDQDKHQAVPVFIIIKEAPPDATYKQKPSKNKFGIRLLLYDDFACDKTDLRTNSFQEGGNDVILDSTKELNHEPDHGEFGAEDATRRIHCSRWKHYHLYTSTTIQDIPSSS
ncbi:unnamed protein product [Brassica oleracea var. botrytis]